MNRSWNANSGQHRLLLILKGVFNLGEIKIFTSATFENVQDVQTSGLKVRGGVVGLRYEKVIRCAIIISLEHVTDLDKFLLDRA